MDTLNALSATIGAKEFIDGLNKSLANPDYPLPKLRRETIGTFCRTNFQLFLAEINGMARVEDDFCYFEDIKMKLFEEPELLISYFRNETNHLMLEELRYIP